MKKANVPHSNGTSRPKLYKLLIVMKLTAVFMIVVSMHASATGFAQNDVSISYKNIELKKLLVIIQKSTPYKFLYEDAQLPKNTLVSVDFENASIGNVLDVALRHTGLSYSVLHNRLVVISKTSNPVATITGSVTNSRGEPLVGATVKVKGKELAVTTDEKGNFTIIADPNSVLVISYTGYATQEIPIGGQATVNVQLVENVGELNEVVVTALGIKKQAKELGYSTTQVAGSELTDSRVPNLANALSGQVAGVSVAGTGTGPTGSTRITIRGNTSLTTGSTPLYIIDGVPLDVSNQGSSGKWGGPDFGDPLSMINPDDIESINVLKGVAASALYGYRGGNGVILITTKSGNKSRGIGLEINNNTTANQLIDERDFQYVYGQGSNKLKPTTAEQAGNTSTSSWGPKIDGSDVVDFKGNTVPYRAYPDNFKNFYQTGLTNQTTVSLAGTGDYGNFRLGITNMNMKEPVPNATMAQQGINFNSNFNLSDKLHVAFAGAYMFEKVKNRPWFSDSPGSVISSTLYLASSYDIRWLDPAVDETGNEILPSPGNVYFDNPYFAANYFQNTSLRNRYTGNISVRYDILDWLSATAQVSRNSFLNDQTVIVPTGTGWEPTGSMTVNQSNNRELNSSFLLEVNKKFGTQFSLHANAGANYQDNLYTAASTGGSLDLPRWYSVKNIINHIYDADYSHYRVNSLLANADIGFRDYLFLSLTARNDWFSTLNPKTNSYLYPSAALSFVFSDAFKLPAFISFGKFRASYATSSHGTDPYKLALSYENVNINYRDLIFSHVVQSTVPNALLKPVSISEAEVGVNMGFFNNRLNVDAAVYNKETKDDILEVAVSTTSGYNSSVQNIGKMRNRGIELLISGVAVQTPDFSWKPSFNIAMNDSKVLFLSPGVDEISLGDGDPARIGTFTIRQIVGMQYGQLLGYKYKRDAAGNKIFDANGLPLRTDDIVPLGSGVYKTTGGFSNDFKYKNFIVSTLIDFKFGAKLFSVTNMDLASRGLTKQTLEGREGGYIGDGVSEGGGKNTVAVDAQSYWQSIAGDGAVDDIAEEFTYDASFIKLRNVSIGYTLPQKILKNTPIKGLTFSLVGRNVATLLKHTPNIDPESNLLSDAQQGVEYNPYPQIRSLGFNINVKF
jgi:TonB-linked SusC/RagA family outer membrane protein